MSRTNLSRRAALRGMALGIAAPGAYRAFAGHAAPGETLLHASIGASGMAASDIASLTAGKNVKLVAVADVDLSRTAEVRKRFPDVRVYSDWRELLDKEKQLDSINVSTPDHMHAPISLTAIRRGLHVYTQKPLAHNVFEARQLARAAAGAKVVTQMGIQIHSNSVHKTVVATIRQGTIGKVEAVHSWSNKRWGDRGGIIPKVGQPVPKGLDWDGWLGVAEPRPFLPGYYHPGEWRKRIDFGTGTFGDMGCHILDPVFGALELTAPLSIHSRGFAPNEVSWGLDARVEFVFPPTRQTGKTPTLFWYDGSERPPESIRKLLGGLPLSDQGSIYVGSAGVLYSPYIDTPVLLPAEKFAGVGLTQLDGDDHYLQFVEACRGNGKTSAPFAYSGPLTETVLLGCVATRFPGEDLAWDAKAVRFPHREPANSLIRSAYRKGWNVEGLG